MTSNGSAAKEVGEGLGFAQAAYREERYAEALERASRALVAFGARQRGDKKQDASGILAGFHAALLSLAVESALNLDRPDEALRIAEREFGVAGTLGAAGASLAQVLNARGRALLETGSIAAAEADFRAGLGQLGRDDAAIRETLSSNLRSVALLRGEPIDPPVSTPYRAMQFDLARLVGAESPEIHRLNWLGITATAERNFAAAERDFRDALREVDRRGAPRRLHGILLSNLGTTILETGDAERALVELERAREILASDGAREPLANVLHSIGKAHSVAGRHAGALGSLKRAWDEIRTVAPSSRSAIVILKDLAIERIVEGDLRRAGAALRRAIEIYEGLRPRIARTEEGQSAMLDVYREVLELAMRLAMHRGWQEELVPLIDRGKARIWREAMIAMVGDEAPLTAGDAEEQGLADQFDDVRSFIGFDCLLLNFFAGSGSWFVYHIFNGVVGARKLDVSVETLRLQVDQFRLDLMSSSARPRWRDSGYVLSELLLGHVKSAGWNIRRIVVMPDGLLWHLPFAALPVPSGLCAADGPDLLGELAPLGVCPSATVLRLLHAKETRQATSAKRRALVVAAPALPEEFVELAGATEEERHIRAALPGDCAVDTLSGSGATRGAFLARAPGATWLHVAAHAVGDPDAGTSCVLLSDGKGGVDRLHASEISRHPIRARVVFLSACCTAVGKESLGEGLMSLARAFLMAGCECVIATMWPLDDDAPPALWTRFYERLAGGESPDRALQHAVGAIRAEGAGARVWATFQLVGAGSKWYDRNSTIHLQTENQ